ncbi:hypothetical protein SPHINGOT1_70088 [Sphingomonas sp. T1]|nr:hypothetical protein SPHINGOT1_70088 [Sphingomonas sp. T1]
MIRLIGWHLGELQTLDSACLQSLTVDRHEDPEQDPGRTLRSSAPLYRTGALITAAVA